MNGWLAILIILLGTGTNTYGFSKQQIHTSVLERVNHTFARIYDVAVHDDLVFVASDQGLYKSVDQGQTWKDIPSAQLPLREIKNILYSEESGLLVATAGDVYQFFQGNWQRVYKGRDTQPITNLDIQEDGIVLITTIREIIPLILRTEEENEQEKEKKDIHISYQEIQQQFQHEPTIQQVQEWAIEYAEVYPEKIKEWREQARKRAWFPSVNMGVDMNRDWNFNDSIWGTSSGSHYIGPDDKSFGKDIGFDISLSWDLADLVWSTDQTSIDNRSKLMVELREDILDQVTRLYFERRRLQVQLQTESLAEESILTHELRVDELSALIDGFTDGKFSAYQAQENLLQVIKNKEEDV